MNINDIVKSKEFFDQLSKVWIPDYDKFNSTLIEAINNGEAVLRRGVAYWNGVSNKKGIIQHITFKEVQVGELQKLVEASSVATQAAVAAKTAAIAAAAVSTGIIVAAIIIQTKYISKKLDKIQKTVDLISKEVHTQNIIFYMDKCADYFGAVETARTLLSRPNLESECKTIAVHLLAELSNKRNKLLSFIDNILNLAGTDAVTGQHYKLIIDFVQMTMELLPFGIHTEYLLCDLSGSPRLAEHILSDGRERYLQAFEAYRSFLEEEKRLIAKGQIAMDKIPTFQQVTSRANELFSSEMNKQLLELPKSERVGYFISE